MKLIYHGSPRQFSQFDYRMIGERGTSEGFGFYFTDSVDIAKQYAYQGYLYTAEFLGKKSLSTTRKTITVSALSRFLTQLHKMGSYLDNYGDSSYEGFHNVLRRAVNSIREYSDNDVDLIGSIINSYGGAEPVLRTLYQMFGYDYVKTKAEWTGNAYIYVLLVPEAFRVISVQPYRG